MQLLACSDFIKNLLLTISESFSTTVESIVHFFGTLADSEVFRVTIAFIPGLLSISYPLIIQTISRLNDQYKSTHIIDRFKKEPRHKWFLWSLISSVFVTLLCVTQFKQFIFLDFLLIVNLLLAFFFNIRLLLTYLSGKDLFSFYSKRLDIADISKYQGKQKLIRKKKLEILNIWHSIVDLYVYAITGRDRKLQEDIRQKFIANAFAFIKYADQRGQEIVLFPTEMYNSTYDIIATFIRNKDDHYHQNIEFFVGNAFFTGDYENKQFLHQQTYQGIWNNLFLLVENDRDDKIYRYWESAHQYCRYNLETLRVQYNDDFEETNESKEFRNKLAAHKTSFVQLHTFLGAYLMYKKRYKALFRVWFFTQSQPPSYVLVPDTMAEIFKLYFSYLGSDVFDHGFTIPYFFKDIEFDAMNGRMDVKSIGRNYLTLVFLKQWLTPFHYGYSRLTIPQLPVEQSDKKYWQENLAHFRKKVEEFISDTDVMRELKLDWINPAECKKRGLPHPLDFLDELEQALKDGFRETLNNLELDEDLMKQFDERTVVAIRNAHDMFSRIAGKDVAANERDPVSDTMQVIRGERTAIDKEALVKNSSESYFGFDNFLGSKIKSDYCGHISIKFSSNTTVSYQVKRELFFDAVDRLKLKADEHAIIAFNVDIEYLKESGQIDFQDHTGDEDYKYKGIPIYTFDVNVPFAEYTLYVLRKVDFPMIKHKDWKDLEGLSEDVKKWWENLEIIDEPLKIYRKFTELDKNQELLNRYLEQQVRSEAELRNMVDINVDFLAYCWFKKGVRIVSLRATDAFQEGGIQNALDEIQTF